jgi:hypothetical protein
MKIPIDCPICNSPLLNEYIGAPQTQLQILHKSCKKTLGHRITFVASPHDHDTVQVISIDLSTDKRINWYPPIQNLLINSSDGTDYHLPYFEPDFSSYNKLIQKIKTYMTFS